MKISISISDDLLQRADQYADANGMTRSGLIAVAVRSYINSQEAAPAVTKLLQQLAALDLGAGLTDEEKQQQLRNLEDQQMSLLDMMKK